MGRKKLPESEKVAKSAMMGFRYPDKKKDFLVKSYGERLPNLLREAADQLIVRAVNNEEILTRAK
jgi:hypothetical protein